MAGPGRPPFANVNAIGVKQAALEISERLYRHREDCSVWILADGGIVVRRIGHIYKDPGDEFLLGVYSKRDSTRSIEADIRRHLSPKKSAECVPANLWPAVGGGAGFGLIGARI